MGYTHYWTTHRDITAKEMKEIGDDFKKLLPVFKHLGIKLADVHGNGDGSNITINSKLIAFNGSKRCGHKKTELVIPWPSIDARGVAVDNSSHIVGDWFAGHQIDARVCDGDCSYESFYFTSEKTDFSFCKTAFRPYDLAVNCILLIAKYHLDNAITVSTDGLTQHWKDAEILCNHFLHYNIHVEVIRGEVIISRL
jgi:hypothetical protein